MTEIIYSSYIQLLHKALRRNERAICEAQEWPVALFEEREELIKALWRVTHPHLRNLDVITK